MRVLLVAAETEMIEGFLSTVSAAGIVPAGVDLAPFAVARAVSPAARGEMGVAGAEAVVDIGAGVTNIIVHHNGEARFVRILLVGGDDPTVSLSEALDLSYEEAEALKLDMGDMAGPPEARGVVANRVDSLVEEIRGSLDYYSSQEDSEPLTSLIVTGGGSLTPGLVSQLETTVGLQAEPGRSLSELDVSKSGLTSDQIAQVEPVAAAAVGLAMGASRR